MQPCATQTLQLGASMTTPQPAYSVMFSYRITDCGPHALGGDQTISSIQRFLESRGYSVFSQESALSGTVPVTSCIESAITNSSVVVVVSTPDYGKTKRNLAEVLQAVRDSKAIITLWHSGSFPADGLGDALQLKGLRRVPSGDRPLVDCSLEEVAEELIMALQQKGCYPSKAAGKPAAIGIASASTAAGENVFRVAMPAILQPTGSPRYTLATMASQQRESFSLPSTSAPSEELPELLSVSQLSISSCASSSSSNIIVSRHQWQAPHIEPGRWHIFLSHYQANAGNTVMSLKLILEQACPGLRCWYDHDEDPSEAGMRKGVENSGHYLLFLTLGALSRPAVQFEAREALRLDKPIIMVKETEPRFGGAANFDDYIAEAPQDLKPLFSKAVAIPWFRDKDFRDVSIKKILRAANILCD